jgi:hypothetical protein
LAYADERAVKVRVALDGKDAVKSASRLAHQINPVLVRALPEVVADRQGVLYVALEAEGGGRLEVRVGRARAPLIERGHKKSFFEGGEVVAHGSEL